MKSALVKIRDFIVTAFAWAILGVWVGVATLFPLVGLVWCIKTLAQLIRG